LALVLAGLILITDPIWAVRDLDALVDRCDAGKQDACDQLARIFERARTKDFGDNRVAIQHLTNQPLLAQIAVQNKSAWLRSEAAARLTDQALLAKIASEDNDADVRSRAVESLNDQSLLAKITMEDPVADIRGAAVAKLTDQTQLAKVATQSSDAKVRWTAVAKLTDQALLIKIATEDNDRIVYKVAIKRLKELFPLLPVPRHIHCPEEYGGECSAPFLRQLAAVQLSWDQPSLEAFAGSLWPKPSNETIESQARVYAAGAILDINALQRIADFWASKVKKLDNGGDFDPVVTELAFNIKIILDIRRRIEALGIENQTGRLRIDYEVSGGGGGSYQGGFTAWGETATISIGTDTTIFVTDSWRSARPYELAINSFHGDMLFLPPPIDVQQLIDHLMIAVQK